MTKDSGLEIEKYEATNFEQVVSEEDVKKVFNKEEDIINYSARALSEVVNKIKPLKPFLKVLGVVKDWGLMQHKIVLYEKEIKKLSDDVKKLREEEKFNDKYYKDEEFVTATLYFTEGLEKAHTEDQVVNLRRAYINLLHNKNEGVNFKSKYVEIASRLNASHVSILGQIIKIFDELEKTESEKGVIRNKGVTLSGAIRELSNKSINLGFDEAAYLIRELEKNNLIECDTAQSGDQYRGRIIAGQTLTVTPGSQFTADEIVDELNKKGWIDNEGRITDKFNPEQDNFSLDLDEKFTSLESEIVAFLKERNKNYSQFKNTDVSEFMDMAIISKPTGFGKKFYSLITQEVYPDKNE